MFRARAHSLQAGVASVGNRRNPARRGVSSRISRQLTAHLFTMLKCTGKDKAWKETCLGDMMDVKTEEREL